MVTTATNQDLWQRARYEREVQPRMPQSIAALLPQVLARYCAVPEQPVDASAVAESRQSAERTQAAA